MKIITLNKLSKGLYLSGPDDQIPEGFSRRYSGVSPISHNSIISRDGSDLIQSGLAAHSIIYFDGNWYFGVGTILYRVAVAKKTGLSGNRLTFAIMSSVAGGSDFLFVAGGGQLFKVDTDGTATDWGIAPPSRYPTLTDGGAGGELDDDAVYQYTVTYKNSATGHRSNALDSSDVAITGDYKCLLHFDGAHGSTTYTQSIAGGPTFTNDQNSDSMIVSWQRKFGSGSLFCSTYDWIKASDSNDFYLSGDFTISLWVRLSTPGWNHGLFSQWDDTNNLISCSAYEISSIKTRVEFRVVNSGVLIALMDYYVQPSPTFSSWFHLEFARSTNDWYMFVDGTLVDTYSSSGSYPNLTSEFNIGRDRFTDPNIHLYGYIDEFAIIKGTALHTASFEPSAVPYGANAIDLSPGSTSVDITSIPQSTDSQVDTIELWRTTGGGAIFYKLTTLSTGDTSYTDNISDADLQSLELPTDNIQPYAWFDDCYGPWNGSMFWITRTEVGERGRLYYSPIGRAEGMQGFIDVTSDSDGLQKIVSHAGNLFVLSKSKGFQIYGNNPYFSRALPGVPGTTLPFTVVTTSLGIMWESPAGVRVFSGGARAELIAYDQIKPIFRGKTVENIAGFTGVVAAFARSEYIIASSANTLSLNVETLQWRELGLICTALTYEPSLDKLAGTVGSNVLEIEKEGETDDNGTDISFDIAAGAVNFVPPAAIEMVRVDADANGETLTCYKRVEGAETSLGNLTTTVGRRYTEFDLGARLLNRFGLRIAGDIDDAVEINSIEVSSWPMELILFINNDVRTIPGRLSGDKQTLTFEAFSDAQDSLQSTYIMERLFYDINTGGETVSVQMQTIDETGTEIGTSLGTLNTIDRTTDAINIAKKGRFLYLQLSGDFTQAIALRRIEIVCRKRRGP